MRYIIRIIGIKTTDHNVLHPPKIYLTEQGELKGNFTFKKKEKEDMAVTISLHCKGNEYSKHTLSGCVEIIKVEATKCCHLDFKLNTSLYVTKNTLEIHASNHAKVTVQDLSRCLQKLKITSTYQAIVDVRNCRVSKCDVMAYEKGVVGGVRVDTGGLTVTRCDTGGQIVWDELESEFGEGYYRIVYGVDYYTMWICNGCIVRTRLE